jgi:hypothetical protein
MIAPWVKGGKGQRPQRRRKCKIPVSKGINWTNPLGILYKKVYKMNN